MGADQTVYYEALMLRAQEQRDAAMAEANSIQQQLYDLQKSSQREIRDLKAEIDVSAHKLKIEYELRTAAETKCSLMECELAELSSHIQFEAQNLVAQERREHRDELERLARKQEEMVQLMEMERAQVKSLKQSLESANMALDREKGETERLRSELHAFERKVSSFVSVPDLPVLRDSAFAESPSLPNTARAISTASIGQTTGNSTSPSVSNSSDSVGLQPATVSYTNDSHIAGVLYFGTDTTRTDTRLTEFLGFVNASSDKEAMQSSFMQRSMREDVEPTLAADSTTSMPSLSGWNKHRRLLHGVQENTLVLESYSPRVKLNRVLSLGCYLCGCSVNRPSASSPPASMSDRIASSSSGGSEKEKRPHMFRMRFSDNDEDNKPICHHCHARMVAVCSFFSYLNIVRKGLIKRPVADIWLEVNKARLQMWLARCGASGNIYESMMEILEVVIKMDILNMKIFSCAGLAELVMDFLKIAFWNYDVL
ncbi:hypothetical protein EC988_000283 [Linderina pennispora]|nr:hypothetical protein EC988_000283 [Linderina pennispora]